MSFQPRTLAIVLVLCALAWAGVAVWADLSAVLASAAQLSWVAIVATTALTAVNYGLRWAKWHMLLREVGVAVAMGPSLGIFLSGFALTITPGKAGELVKPHLLQQHMGASWERTVPVLLVERLTDALALALLAAVGVSQFAPEWRTTAWLVVASLSVLPWVLTAPVASRWATSLFSILGLLPADGTAPVGLGQRLATLALGAWRSLAAAARPKVFALGLLYSVPAWWAECIGLWCITQSLSVPLDLGGANFVYAFSTLFGAPSPGGLGATDAALAASLVQLAPPTTTATAVTATLVVRVLTLWIGVALGAVLLLSTPWWLSVRADTTNNQHV